MNTQHIAAVTVLLAAAVVPVANADIINVPGDQPTIQAGIDAAVDGDEVVVADGVYTGPGNRELQTGTKLITVRSASGPDTCIIDCVAAGRAFVISGGARIDGFTVRNGLAVPDFAVLNQEATGSPNSQTVIGVGVGSLAGPSDGAAFIESITTFSGAGPGRISFVTQHLWASGKTATTQGTTALVGNPEGVFGPEVTMLLTMDTDETDGDNSDGIMAGTLIGEVTILGVDTVAQE